MSDYTTSKDTIKEDLNLRRLLSWHFSYIQFDQLQQAAQLLGLPLSETLIERLTNERWSSLGLLKPKQLDALSADDLTQKIEEALQWAAEPQCSLKSCIDADYPTSLLKLHDAPILLYIKGQRSLLNDPQIAIVGSRHASKQGCNTAKDFAQHLSKMGLCITSGLALGIDAAAHEGALLGQGGTVAVVGTGLDRIYPASNKQLGHQIVDQGVMVSEFALGTRPLTYNFPRRNRIISGLSVGTLVVEAALNSGSLITAKQALEQGKEVFAVPGSINNPQAKGCHYLIKQGAKLVESGADILQELQSVLQLSLFDSDDQGNDAERHLSSNNESSAFGQSQAFSKLLTFIEYDPISLDELVVLTKLPVSELQTKLMQLEMSGQIEAMSAGRWRRLG